MERPRPTLRCLRDDLDIALPALTTSLEEMDHPLLDKAREQFVDGGAQERIRAIDDRVLFKIKRNRWRGAGHSATFDGFTVGILVQVNEGHETYVAVRVVGSVPAQLMAIVLRQVPGCATDGWYPEFELPHRSLHSNEQAWSNLMDPDVAAKLLDE